MASSVATGGVRMSHDIIPYLSGAWQISGNVLMSFLADAGVGSLYLFTRGETYSLPGNHGPISLYYHLYILRFIYVFVNHSLALNTI